ncbi:MAG: hypothetical protein U0350_04000 [Caldilineaceae bacterium]
MKAGECHSNRPENGANMNLVFHSTEPFEQDRQQFDAGLQAKIVRRVNEVAKAFIEDRQLFVQEVEQPYPFPLYNGFDSSLYAIVVEPNLRIILTIDDDPLFDQAIVTLLRVVKQSALYNAYTAAAKSLYQNASISFP